MKCGERIVPIPNYFANGDTKLACTGKETESQTAMSLHSWGDLSLHLSSFNDDEILTTDHQ